MLYHIEVEITFGISFQIKIEPVAVKAKPLRKRQEAFFIISQQVFLSKYLTKK